MSYYALTDSDWPWDDRDEGRAIVVRADSPQEAVKVATEMHLKDSQGAGGIDWKVARLMNVGFEGVDWEDDKKANFDGFNYYPLGSNGPPDLPPDLTAADLGVNAEPAPDTCERCQGNGEIVTDWDRYRHPHPGDKGDEAVAECPDCGGEGVIDCAVTPSASGNDL